MELSKVLGVHLGTLNNWLIRGILPPAVENPRLPRNKNWFRISSIKAWLEGTTEEAVIWNWAFAVLPEVAGHLKSLDQLAFILTTAYDIYGLLKPNIPFAL